MSFHFQSVTVHQAQRAVLQDINLIFPAHQLTVIIGLNGAGKSTLLRTAIGLHKPTSGKIYYENKLLHEWQTRIRAQKIAYLPQMTETRLALTVQEIVSLGRYPYRSPYQPMSDYDQERIEFALNCTKTQHLIHKKMHTLSGGECQRVLLARCLATDAETLVLDEPTAHIDLMHALEILNLCKQLVQTGKTIIMALHDLNAALQTAQHLVWLHQGYLIAAGTPTAVLSDERIHTLLQLQVQRFTRQDGQAVLSFYPFTFKNGTD